MCLFPLGFVAYAKTLTQFCCRRTKARRKSPRRCWANTWLSGLRLILRSPRTACSPNSPSATRVLDSQRICSFPRWQSLVRRLLEARSCLVFADPSKSAIITFGGCRGKRSSVKPQRGGDPWAPSERGKTILVGPDIDRETRACFPGPRSGFVVGPHQNVPGVAGEKRSRWASHGFLSARQVLNS